MPPSHIDRVDEESAAIDGVELSFLTNLSSTENEEKQKLLSENIDDGLMNNASQDESIMTLHLHAVPGESLSASRFASLIEEIKEQSKTTLPALQSLVLSKIPWFISLRFLGHLGGHELAAAALATTLHNVTGMSLCVGLSFALSTLAGQARGEMISRSTNEKNCRIKRRSTNVTIETNGSDEESSFVGDNEDNIIEGSNKDIVGTVDIIDDSLQDCDPNDIPITPIVFLIRGMCIQLCLVLPVGIWWLAGIEQMLISLGQGIQTANMAATYIKILTPSLWTYSIQWTLTAWVQAIGMADVPARGALLGLLLHVPFNWLFVYGGTGWGYLGCGVATVAFQLVLASYTIIYLFVYPKGRERVLEATGGAAIGRTRLTFGNEFHLAIGSLKGFWQYLLLAVPGIVIISEWWASETAIFLSGRLTPNPEETLAGMTIYQSINAFCFMFPMAFAVSGTSRVGNLLGAGLDKAASWAGTVCVGCAATISSLLGLTMYVLPHDLLPRLFAPDEQGVIDEASKTISLLSLYVIADGIQVALNGIIKGCGRQCVTVPIVVVAYWIVAVPLAYYVAFVKNKGVSSCVDDVSSYLCGDVGLVGGMTIGTWCHMLLLAIVVVGTTNWKQEARKAKERVSEEN